MKISIIHPSRSRPQMAADTKSKWLNSADCKENIEYRIICDEDDPEVGRYQYQNGYKNILICNNQNHSCITAINFGALHSNGELLIVVSDDFDCPEHWDTLLLTALVGKEDFCIKTNDNYQPFIMTLPIMDRKYYNRFGYIYNPEYLHMFCDTEMSAVAWMLGKYIKANVTFVHKHYTTGAMVKDAINEKNDATWAQGEAVFHRRITENFGIENPVNTYSSIKWN